MLFWLLAAGALLFRPSPAAALLFRPSPAAALTSRPSPAAALLLAAGFPLASPAASGVIVAMKAPTLLPLPPLPNVLKAFVESLTQTEFASTPLLAAALTATRGTEAAGSAFAAAPLFAVLRLFAAAPLFAALRLFALAPVFAPLRLFAAAPLFATALPFAATLSVGLAPGL
ncbi:hypothetical protein ACQP2F_11780 [Actinoplanes sp. CA-030573]|uniref:hypothetical protein n=1 Tax=Actinoplanes sp. CA-030573 TaxID=3239898 RepID=UPI003D940AC9